MADQELSVEERCKLAAGFIVQSPPGEVNDVINDIRAIISDDTALMPHVRPALREYNQTQLHVVEHPAAEDSPAHTSLLSTAALLPGSEGERYVDAEGKRSFAFDHVTLGVSDYEPYTLPEEEEAFRASLAKSLAAYTKNHFPAGHSSVSCSQYPLLPPAPPAPEPEASEPITEQATIPASESKDEPSTGPVTDVVPEQVNSGKGEPVPTPAVGLETAKTDETKDDETVHESNLETVDEKVEEVKAEEEGLTAEENTSEKPVVEEEVSESKHEVNDEKLESTSEKIEGVEVEQPLEKEEEKLVSEPVVERKQERIEDPVYTLEIVGNRYNPSNFWTGRWRTQWVVNQSAGTVEGTIRVDVHYYEQGNVQLATSHKASFPYPSSEGNQSIPSQIVTTISKIETAYHMELNDVYGELGDKAFRALRRALPITRQKMEWEKISGYGLGSELTQARA